VRETIAQNRTNKGVLKFKMRITQDQHRASTLLHSTREPHHQTEKWQKIASGNTVKSKGNTTWIRTQSCKFQLKL